MLSNKEWLRINDIILIIYSTKSVKDMCNYFFNAIQPLMLYEKAMFYWLKENDNDIDLVDPVFVNVDSDFFEAYKSSFNNSRYGRVAVNIRRTIAFRDSDLIPESITNTDIYRSFMLPNKLPYGGGIILTDNDTLLAEFAFFKTEEQGNFTDKEIYILDILKKHFEIRIIRENYFVSSNNPKTDKILKLIELGLTNREIEIVILIIESFSTFEISSKLHISIHTTKKHINNIFTKLRINSRLQLIQLFSNL